MCLMPDKQQHSALINECYNIHKKGGAAIINITAAPH